jgi:hypothetical protein
VDGGAHRTYGIVLRIRPNDRMRHAAKGHALPMVAATKRGNEDRETTDGGVRDPECRSSEETEMTAPVNSPLLKFGRWKGHTVEQVGHDYCRWLADPERDMPSPPRPGRSAGGHRALPNDVVAAARERVKRIDADTKAMSKGMLDAATLDLAARAAYDASCAVRDAEGSTRDFKVQIAEWRAIAQAAATAAQFLRPSMLDGIDRAVGIPEGSDATTRTNAIIDSQMNLTMASNALKTIARSGGSSGTSGDGHQQAVQTSDYALRMLACGPLVQKLGLEDWAGR